MKPIMHTIWDWEFERTTFADDGYAIIGRALAYAVKFEADCRSLNVLLATRSAIKSGTLSLDDKQAFSQFVLTINALNLNRHIQEATGRLQLSSNVIDLLGQARESRNRIVHDLCLGVQPEIETDEGRKGLIHTIQTDIRRIAQGDMFIMMIVSLLTHEPNPARQFLDRYCDRVVDWVCRTDEL